MVGKDADQLTRNSFTPRYEISKLSSSKDNIFGSSNIVLLAMSSLSLNSTKKKFRAKNSRARESIFSMQSENALEKIEAGWLESCLGLSEGKHRGRKSEPARLRVTLKQVTKAKEGPLETGSRS